MVLPEHTAIPRPMGMEHVEDAMMEAMPLSCLRMTNPTSITDDQHIDGRESLSVLPPFCQFDHDLCSVSWSDAPDVVDSCYVRDSILAAYNEVAVCIMDRVYRIINAIRGVPFDS